MPVEDVELNHGHRIQYLFRRISKSVSLKVLHTHFQDRWNGKVMPRGIQQYCSPAKTWFVFNMIRGKWSIHSVRSLDFRFKAVEKAFKGAETSERTQSSSRIDHCFPLKREIKRVCLEFGAFFYGCKGF